MAKNPARNKTLFDFFSLTSANGSNYHRSQFVPALLSQYQAHPALPVGNSSRSRIT